jgi:hypothetical protein
MSASHSDTTMLFENTVIKIPRGSFVSSRLKLAERWGWSVMKVDRFLELLKTFEMCDTKRDNKKTHIFITNYDTYQTNKITDKTTNKTTNEKQTKNRRDTINQLRNNNILSKLNITPTSKPEENSQTTTEEESTPKAETAIYLLTENNQSPAAEATTTTTEINLDDVRRPFPDSQSRVRLSLREFRNLRTLFRSEDEVYCLAEELDEWLGKNPDEEASTHRNDYARIKTFRKFKHAKNLLFTEHPLVGFGYFPASEVARLKNGAA